jgi:hypothetical protein
MDSPILIFLAICTPHSNGVESLKIVEIVVVERIETTADHVAGDREDGRTVTFHHSFSPRSRLGALPSGGEAVILARTVDWRTDKTARCCVDIATVEQVCR